MDKIDDIDFEDLRQSLKEEHEEFNEPTDVIGCIDAYLTDIFGWSPSNDQLWVVYNTLKDLGIVVEKEVMVKKDIIEIV